MKKLTIFSLSAYNLSNLVSADWQKMNQDYNDLVYQKVEALANNTDLYDFSEDFESVVKKLTTVDLSIIQDYGCYCNFDDNDEKESKNNDNFREKAKGRPLDDIDRFCKALHDGYTCAQVDGNNNKEEENENSEKSSYSCKPWQTTYNSAFNNGLYHDLRMDQLSYLCKKANPNNSCAARACQIEGWFVQSFFTYFANGGKVDLNNLKHSNGFKHKNNCFGTTKKIEELDCCNNYPLRYPFRNKEGAKKCCRSVTYNVLTHQCCEDGTVRMECNSSSSIENYEDSANDQTFTKRDNKKIKQKVPRNNMEKVTTTTEANKSSIPEPIIITDLNAIDLESEVEKTIKTENNKHENHRIKFKKAITSQKKNHGTDTL